MRQLSFKQIGLTGLLFIILLTGCDCGKPTEPGPIITETEYPVYFRKDEDAFGTSTYLHKYFPDTNVLDSILMPDTFLFFAISPDGKQIYIPSGTVTKIYDIETQELINVLPYFGKLSFSPDSQLIAITGITELNVIDANDYSLVFHDTNSFSQCIFTRDNKILFCFNSGSVNPNIILFNMENNYFKTEKQVVLGSGLSIIIPSFTGEKMFIYRNVFWDASSFEVYDFSVDSIIFRNIHSPGHGLMTISPNGKFVFFTNPGTLLVGTFPPPIFNAYDVEKNELLEISTLNFPGTENDSIKGMIAQEVAATADGKWLTAIGLGGYIVAIEIESMTILKSRKVTIYEHTWWNLTSSISTPL